MVVAAVVVVVLLALVVVVVAVVVVVVCSCFALPRQVKDFQKLGFAQKKQWEADGERICGVRAALESWWTKLKED